ncbi:unnamed protein product [Psylliodes chrysocephalus]|uniref:Uncharacterized protein n=1 Tax=Psylliodes chrysocephalus TaxID=3402493 RepID=A0A9P0D024_9CUCU|nr:unnamed protein product [Psylliodes chrysocephala]
MPSTSGSISKQPICQPKRLDRAEKGHNSSESDEEHGQENDESENFSVNSDDLPLINIKKSLQHSKNAEIFSDEGASISAEVKEGSWIVVEYEVKKSTKHFIGQVKQVLDSTLHVEFLKKSDKSSGRFITPLVQDTDHISGDMVVKILTPPILTGTGRRKFYSFNIDLMPFNF